MFVLVSFFISLVLPLSERAAGMKFEHETYLHIMQPSFEPHQTLIDIMSFKVVKPKKQLNSTDGYARIHKGMILADLKEAIARGLVTKYLPKQKAELCEHLEGTIC